MQDIRAPVVEGAIAGDGGRIVKCKGDGVPAEFGSVVDARSAAIAIQEAMLQRNAAVPSHAHAPA